MFSSEGLQVKMTSEFLTPPVFIVNYNWHFLVLCNREFV